MRIFLWDIDGTLLTGGGAGMRALAQAVRTSLPATSALGRLKLNGMTDRRIARILCASKRHLEHPEIPLEEHQRAVTSGEIDGLLASYLAALRASASFDGLRMSGASQSSFKVHPGVREMLDALGPDRAVHGLGTGNIEEGARAKLEPLGLWSRFAFGGFGSDAEERPDILRAAWRKAELFLGRSCEAGDIVVIGDTPFDIAAAHSVGFCCVAVATGGHSTNELAQSGGDLVLSSLDEPDAAARVFAVRRK